MAVHLARDVSSAPTPQGLSSSDILRQVDYSVLGDIALGKAVN